MPEETQQTFTMINRADGQRVTVPVTPWYPISQSPTRDGDYEYDMGITVTLREYRGGCWRRDNGQPLIIYKSDRWRGIRKD